MSHLHPSWFPQSLWPATLAGPLLTFVDDSIRGNDATACQRTDSATEKPIRKSRIAPRTGRREEHNRSHMLDLVEVNLLDRPNRE